MNLLSLFRELICRVLERKKTLIVFAMLYLVFVALGIVFIKTPAIYSYHINLCDRFIDRICYSQQSVILIFIERLAGNAIYLTLLLCSGVHTAGLVLLPVILGYRAYTFGGSLAIFFSVYRMSGVLIVFVLYLPIHLLLDAVFLCATSVSFFRAKRFRFKGDDFTALLRDFILLLVLVAAICLLEMLLLLVVFHPLGNLM